MSKTAKTPKLRFKGFTDAWEQCKFSMLYKKSTQKNDFTYGPDKIISVANMYFNKDCLIGKESYLLTYNLFELGDIAFEGHQNEEFAHGRFVENTIGNGIVSHIFDVYKPIMKQYNLLFWKYAINNERLMREILIRSTKSSTMMSTLVAKDFLQEEFNVPSYTEQRKIGSLLATLDTLITLHQRKLEKLKIVKKSLLEKMFPKNGEKIPELRFKGFTDAWEQCTFNDCFIERNDRSAFGELLSVTIDHGIKKFSELNRHDNSSTDKSNYKCVKKGDIAYNSMRMWQGASGYSFYEGIVSPAYTVITPKADTDALYFSIVLKDPNMIKRFQLSSQGITSDTWNLKFPAFSQIILNTPKLNEQIKIGKFFTKLDTLITLHQRKLEKLKIIKKSLLEKMFV